MSLEAAPSLLLARAESDMGHTPPALPTRAMEAATPVTALTTLDCCIVPAVEPQSGQMGGTIGAGIARIAGATSAATSYVTGATWRGSTVVQASHWLCRNCDTGVSNSLQHCRCGAGSVVGATLAQQESRRRLQESVSSSHYGRSLLCMSGSVQRHDMPDILGGYDEDDYGERVSTAIANLLPSSHRTEMSEYLPEGVWDFDAFLALETRGKLSISTKERAAAFADTGKGTNLMKSFVALHAVSVTARGLDGEVSTVQVAIPLSNHASTH